MKTHDRDINTYISIVDSFLSYANVSERERKLLSTELKRYIHNKFGQGKWVHPMITKFCTDWYREFYRLIDHDPYEMLKNLSNDKISELLPQIKPKNFKETVMALVIGNKIDFGASLILKPNFDEIENMLCTLENLTFDIDETSLLEQKIKKAKNVFYLFDNNGEVLIDFLLIKNYISKYVAKENIYFVAKESPMLNDVTVANLYQLGFHKYGNIISTGSNCFGLHEEDVSTEFKLILKHADLIIAKGQAYFEFFTEYSFTNVFNILYIKHPVRVKEQIFESHQKIVISSEKYALGGQEYKYHFFEDRFAA